MNNFQKDLAGTSARASAERHVQAMRTQGGVFVDAVRLTRMPMLVTDPTLPGNPITFANQAFVELSGYTQEELMGQDPHFMNGPDTDPESIARYETTMAEGRQETLEILQYRKGGTPFRAMLFASPLDDGQGTVTSHFLSYLDVTRRYEAERELRLLTEDLEARVAARTLELEIANDRLQRLVEEREMLLVEVNHRAKNSLAVAGALLHVQGRRQKDSAVKALFREAQDHLNAMAQVHDMLSRSESSQHVDLARYVTDLGENLSKLDGGRGSFVLSFETEPGVLVDADVAFPLGIILNELVTNAAKYAFPENRSGTVLVRALRRGVGRAELVVRDDGVGMAEPREGSLGYGLIRSLVRQIDGDLSVQGDQGLTVTVTFSPSGRRT